jgi:hypothetical protein
MGNFSLSFQWPYWGAHFRTIFTVIFAFILVIKSWALESLPNENLNDQNYQMLFNKIEKMRQTLSQSAQSSGPCSGKVSENCSFTEICKNFSGSEKEAYLYQDQEGHQLPNYPLLSTVSQAEACLQKPFLKAPIQDPFLYPELFVNAGKAGGKKELKRNRNKLAKEKKRTQEIFKDAQERTISMLQKKGNASNLAQIEALIARVRSVRLEAAELGDGEVTLSAAGCEMPNAFYQRESHKVVLCPQVLNLPEGTLFQILSHELGHSIDPCTLAFSYSKNKMLGYTQNTSEFFFGANEKYEISLPAFSSQSLPIKNVLSCLEANKEMDLEVPSQSVLIQNIKKEMALDPENPYLEARIEQVSKNYSQFKYCSAISGQEKIQEAFADWVSAEALNEKLSNQVNASQNKKVALEFQLFMAGIDCENVKKASSKWASDLKHDPKNKCLDVKSTLAVNSEVSKRTHPKSQDRVDQILLTKPENRKALGCLQSQTAAHGKNCEL